ncbi:hypothetical protein DEO72_LG3g1642 [Vigna unguiculata]|uniref:Uncharacterized protein n=1 Tax=Vigna unguiculata TaxID=3917 RepID=A0A4D6LF30_VIGUN|nr:hypothetical protein DEO72_LG3g1642 [Vigna unguiculata]
MMASKSSRFPCKPPRLQRLRHAFTFWPPPTTSASVGGLTSDAFAPPRVKRFCNSVNSVSSVS